MAAHADAQMLSSDTGPWPWTKHATQTHPKPSAEPNPLNIS